MVSKPPKVHIKEEKVVSKEAKEAPKEEEKEPLKVRAKVKARRQVGAQAGTSTKPPLTRDSKDGATIVASGATWESYAHIGTRKI